MGRCKGEDVRVMGNRQLSHYSAKIIMYDDSGARIMNTGMIDLELALSQLDAIISKKLKHDSKTYSQWKLVQKKRGNT
jgi:hypothetical protein